MVVLVAISAKDFLSRFVAQGDSIEIRGLPSKKEEAGRSRGAHPEQYFLTSLDSLPDFHTGLNWYFGVACRKAGSLEGGKKDLAHTKALFADFDGITAREASERIENAALPKPSIINGSGHGAHAYWFLDAPIDLSNVEELARYEAALKLISDMTGSDPRTTNADRILRIPGTMNVKREPHTPCLVLDANDSTYGIKEFLFPPEEIIRRLWRTGARHDLALGTGAFLRHRGVREEAAREFLEKICLNAEDEEKDDRLRALADAYRVEKAAYKEFFERSLKFLSGAFKGALDALYPGPGRIKEYDEHRWRIVERGARIRAGPYYAPDNTVSWLECRTSKDGDASYHETEVIGSPVEFTDFYDLDGEFIERLVLDGRTEIMGDAGEVAHKLRTWGIVSRERLLKDCLDGVRLMCTNNGAPIHRGHKAVGVYIEGGQLYLDMRAVPRTQFQKETLDALDKIDMAVGSAAFEPWSHINEWYRPQEVLTLMGWAGIGPFLYEIKNSTRVKGDFSPYPFLIGPHGLGKSTLNRIFTTMLYGTPARAGKVIDSEFRMAQLFDSTTFPTHVGECDQLEFDNYSAKLKAAAEEPFLDSRGDPKLGMTNYFARAPLSFDANAQPISDENLIIRFIIVPFEKSTEASRKERRTAFQKYMATLSPIGLSMVEDLCENINAAAASEGIQPVDYIMRNTREIEARLRDVGISFVDDRRRYAWALVYVGLILWKMAFKAHGVEWRLSSIEEFAREVVAPLEEHIREEYRTTNAAQFRAWLEMYLVESVRVVGDRHIYVGRDEVWAEDDDYWYVTQAMLSKYNRSHRVESPYKNLKHLARDVQSIWGGDMDEIYKYRKMGRHTKMTVRVSRGDQTKVTEAPPRIDEMNTGARDDDGNPERLVLNVLTTRTELFPHRPSMSEEEIGEATGLEGDALQSAISRLRQRGDVFMSADGYRVVDTL